MARHPGPAVGPDVRIVGHRWSSRSYELRDLVARNQLSYDFLRADEPEGARLLEAAGADPDQLPVVITEDGTALVQPTDAEVVESAGLSTTASEAVYDLAVIGGGPGGLGASVYGGSEGLRTVLIESRATGGQAGTSSRIENYLGFPNGVSGDQLTTRARLQAEKFGTEVLTTRTVTNIEPRGRARVITFDDGSRSPRTPWCWPPASPTGCSTARGSRSTPGRACSTAPRPPRRTRAPTRTSTSSAAPTRRARRR